MLINEYLPGQGIMAHTDGPLFHPVISTISCGSHTILRFHKNNTNENDKMNETSNGDNNNAIDKQQKIVCQLLLEPRSLLILKDDMYKKYLHSIDDLSHDTINEDLMNLDLCELKNRIGETIKRNQRISLTIRHVPKTSKIHLRLGH